MTKLASLFASQFDATRALDALNQYDFGDIEIEVVEGVAEAATRTDDVVPVVPVRYRQDTGLQGDTAFLPYLDDMDLDDDEAEFFRRGVRHGGVLVLVEVDDDHGAAVEQLLRDHGGRTAEQD